MTNEEQLERMIYYTNGKLNVFVFEHGTCVVGAIHEEAAKRIMKHYDVPHDGEGSPLGDFDLLSMDDGNFLISFTGGQYYVSVVKSAAELKSRPEGVQFSPTEGFAAPRNRTLGEAERTTCEALHGIAARANRTKDARGLNVVLRYVP